MWTQLGEDNMCSSFLPLPSSYNGGECSGKYLLLFISHNKGCQYYIGEYKDDRFYPESHGRMAFADKTFFAPEALIDGKGRQIMWTWLNDKLPDEESRFYWSGVFSLPRVLWYENGELRYAPAQELENLRINKIEDAIIFNKNNQSFELKGFDPDCCEINFEAKDGLKLKISNKEDNNQYSEIYYDYGNKCLVVDTTKSGAEGSLTKESVILILNENESCNVRLFIDKSVIEVFANSKVGITRRLFTSYQRVITLESATHIGEVTVTAYELMATNPF